MIRSILTTVILATALPVAAQVPAQLPSPVARDTEGLSAGIQRQLQECWSVPPNNAGQRVTITLSLLGDGTLAQDPLVELADDKARAKQAQLIESAIRAVRRCAPFTAFDGRGLDPREKFTIAVTFVG